MAIPESDGDAGLAPSPESCYTRGSSQPNKKARVSGLFIPRYELGGSSDRMKYILPYLPPIRYSKGGFVLLFTGECYYCYTPIDQGMACEACKSLSFPDFVFQSLSSWLKDDPQVSNPDFDISNWVQMSFDFQAYFAEHGVVWTSELRRQMFGEEAGNE